MAHFLWFVIASFKVILQTRNEKAQSFTGAVLTMCGGVSIFLFSKSKTDTELHAHRLPNHTHLNTFELVSTNWCLHRRHRAL